MVKLKVSELLSWFWILLAISAIGLVLGIWFKKEYYEAQYYKSASERLKDGY